MPDMNNIRGQKMSSNVGCGVVVADNSGKVDAAAVLVLDAEENYEEDSYDDEQNPHPYTHTHDHLQRQHL